MKNQIFNYNDPHLESHIKAEGEGIINESAQNGEFTAELNKPPAVGGSYYPLVGDIVSGFNELLAFTDQRVQASLNGLQALWDKQAADEKKESIKNKIREVKDRVRAKVADLKRIANEYPWKWYWWTLIGVAAITGVEAIYTTKSFQLFGDSFLVSLFIAVALWITLFFTSHNLPKVVSIGRTRKQRTWLAIGITALLFVVFYILGLWRLAYLERVNAFLGENNNLIDGLSPWQFALINLFLLGIATLVAHTKLPSKQDRLAKEKHDEVKQEVDQLNNEVKALERKLEAIDKEVKQTRARRGAIIKYAKFCENWIYALYEKAIAAFQKENILKRKDNEIPECFREDPPKLRFYYDDLDV